MHFWNHCILYNCEKNYQFYGGDVTTFKYIFLKRLNPHVSTLKKHKRMAIANGTCVSFCNQPKAHFGLLWVRPWDNRGKCHMDEKRIQCLSKQCSMYSSIFNRFPVIQPVTSKVRHFSTFFAHFTPGTIAVNVTWIERGFNAGQTHSSIYPSSIFNRYYEL